MTDSPSAAHRVFDTVLVANRGEIAVRIIRTLCSLGIRSVAVYSDADANARHVREADGAVRLGPAAPAESYLSVERVVAAAVHTGAQAVHPGYGFLAENPRLARACADAGLVFVGPPPEAIEAMGDKIAAKAAVVAAGVPVVPGTTAAGLADDELVAAAAGVGYPVLVKPSAGGGGKGMRLVRDPGALPAELAGARREARAAFGDDTLLLERYVESPRHIEVQVLADAYGHVVHLGERECSLQRRHQKVVEESPSPLLDDRMRDAMGAAAVAAARACGYVNAGTVEFIVPGDRPEEFFFLEMNTRLQVEHPVTELVTGLDLVELQLRVAAGEPLELRQHDVVLRGHAVEARVYAEDPDRGFLPSTGTVLALHEPTDHTGVRVDSGLDVGTRIGGSYDPMLAKVVAWGPDRDTALRRLDDALGATVVLGVTTNVPLLRDLVRHPEVRAGRLDTGLVERVLGEHATPNDVPGDVLMAAALEHLLALEPEPGAGPWEVPGSWRLGGPAWATWRFGFGAAEGGVVRTLGRAGQAQVRIGDGEPVPGSARIDGGTLRVTLAGTSTRYAHARDGRTVWLGRGGRGWALRETEPYRSGRAGGRVAAEELLRSPMPGTVLLVHVAAGDVVVAGQPVAVVEAMKMEHVVSAAYDGALAELYVVPGRSVALDEPLARVVPQPPSVPEQE
ncbi:MAG TPA: biotin carboxylase N-terminal domain-containing protein [Actinomycetes bacterium]